MGFTLSEKILLRKAGLDSVKPGDILTVAPDRVMSHDNTAFIIKSFLQTGYSRIWDPSRVVIMFDHCVPAETPAHRQNHQEAREFAASQGLSHFFDDRAGVCHQVMVERGFVRPGEIILGADSHSTLYGALGALGIPINRTEMAGVWATGQIWLQVPETIRIQLDGTLSPGVYAKDIVLMLLGTLGSDGAIYKTLEYCGSAVDAMSMSSRMTLTNMAVEFGAKAGLIACDQKTLEFLSGEAGVAETLDEEDSDRDAQFAESYRYNVADLEPQLACPHEMDNIEPITARAGTRVDQAYLGSCTNGRLEDLRVAAEILRGRRVAHHTKLVIYPASYRVLREANKQGILAVLEEAGGSIMTASCGPCFGAVGSTLEKDQVCISSSNRNFCGRMGSKESFVYLASPATVAASAVSGEIADPREFTSPR
jgi:homoaconitate hydratase family protein